MNQSSFRSWSDFIQFTGTSQERMRILRSSSLSYIPPAGAHRHIIWVASVPPDFAIEAMNFYKQTKERQEISLPNLVVRSINDDVEKIYSANFSSLVENNNFKRREILNILSIFASKRPDIGYTTGMNKIAGVIVQMFNQEVDAFVMFAHTIENIFPKDYFNKNERQLTKRTELRIFAIMAENLRPRLVDSLKAIFKPANSKSKQTDFSPFVQLMKKIAEVLFDNLMTSIMVPNEFLRVWDNLYIHGFDFLHKLALAYLSKNEKFLKNIIKTETKTLRQGTSVDALIIAGNAAKSKLLKRTERLGIEALIKKALSKRNYNSVSREKLYEQASEIERNYIERIIRLKQTREILRNKKQNIDFASIKNIYEKLDSIDKDGTIGQDDFIRTMTNTLNWKHDSVINLFASFDQEGELFIDKRELKAGFAVLADASIEERLELCFISFDENNSGDLDPNEVVDMICIIEKSLDFHSSFFKTQSSMFYDRLDVNADGKVTLDEFIKIVKREPGCQPIIHFLTALDSENIDPPALLRQVNVAIEGEFLESHSPIDKRSENSSPISDTSFEGFNSSALLRRLRAIDEQRILNGFERKDNRVQRMTKELREGKPEISDDEYSYGDEDVGKIHLSSQDTEISTRRYKVSKEHELGSLEWESEPEDVNYSKGINKNSMRARCSRLCSNDECVIF